MHDHSGSEQRSEQPDAGPGLAVAGGVGLAASAVLIGIWSVSYGIGAVPYPPFDLADWIIRRAPGGLSTWAIENAGHLAQQGILAAGILIWLALGSLLGLVIRYRPTPDVGSAAALVLLPLALLVSRPVEGGVSAGYWMWWTLFFGTTLFFTGRLIGYWLHRIRAESLFAMKTRPHSSWVDQPASLERREVLTQAFGAALLFGLGGGLAAWLIDQVVVGDAPTSAGRRLRTIRDELRARATEESRELILPEATPAAPIPEDFPAPAGIRPRLTSNDDFYTVDISTRNPNLPEDSWTLRVYGDVDNELLLGYQDLLSFQPVELGGTLMCISYYYGSGLISTTRWTGVPMRDILQMAGLRDTAADIVMRGAGGYSDSFPVEKGLEPWTLLAYGMNGDTLPRDHGFPCRVYAPNLYGIKNVKWLQEIEVTSVDYRGYWQERGWSETGRISTISVIDTPAGEATRDANGMVPVGGIAFAGSRGIQAVRVRIDQGPWQDARVEPYRPELVWQRWRFDWFPEPGQHEITVQAVDGSGTEQIAAERPPHPDGMTGLHHVEVVIS